jgi:two-component system, cell cycle sensor histidine kinase PleC
MMAIMAQASTDKSLKTGNGKGAPGASKAGWSAPLRVLAPTSLAVIATALGSAALFCAYDGYRTFEDTRSKVQLMAALAAAEMAPRDLAAPRAPASLPDDAMAGAHLLVLAVDGEVISSSTPLATPGNTLPEGFDASHLSAEADIAGDAGSVTIAVPYATLATTTAQRSAGIMGASLLVLILLLRRRPRTMPAVSETQAADLFDDVPYGVARWSADGMLVAANPPFSRLLRLKGDPLVAGTPYGFVTRQISGRITTRPVLDADRRRLVEIEREDGSTILLDERSSGDGLLTLVSDITERKAADLMLSKVREDQRQLARQYHDEKLKAEAASRAKTAFLAHLSHDIRTPLNHIIGFADMIRMETYGPLGDNKYRTYVEDIRRSGQSLLSSFGEILEYAELEGGHKELEPEVMGLGELMQRTLTRFSTHASKAGLRLYLAQAPQGAIYADRLCVDRMLANIIENAIKFTPRGGEIRLGAWQAEDGVVLEISDTGIGMSDDQLSRFSQPFALGDASAADPQCGIGLGIAIARTIAELSGGRLAIDSRLSVGTTVAVSLPLAKQQPQTGVTARAA